MQAFADTRCWIFDLDNTLYPAECNLFAQVDQRMGEFISDYLDVSFEEARALQKGYYFDYGTTLAGLMQRHGLQPSKFLDYVHDIDFSPVEDAPDLARALDRLPGEKFIFTNGTSEYARKVAAKLGVLDRFDGVFDIAGAGYVPKPQALAYERFLEAHAVEAGRAAMFEDLPHNLKAPHALGMATVLVKSSYHDHPAQADIETWDEPPLHVHHMTDDLTGFLDAINASGVLDSEPSN